MRLSGVTGNNRLKEVDSPGKKTLIHDFGPTAEYWPRFEAQHT